MQDALFMMEYINRVVRYQSSQTTATPERLITFDTIENYILSLVRNEAGCLCPSDPSHP